MAKELKDLEKEMDKLLLCKSFTEVKKQYSKEDMIQLIKKYMKNEPLDYDSEIEAKLEECNDICKWYMLYNG
jgi:hypothetical protein